MAAIVNVCVDPRLDHEVIRAQVRGRIERLRLPPQLIYVIGEVGGNVGPNLRTTAELVLRNGDSVRLVAVLHHDDCVADRVGLRRPLAAAIEAATKALGELKVEGPLLAGMLRSEDSYLTWADEPPPRYEVLTFRMPRL